MDEKELIKLASSNGIKKITGPPCDWLKALNTESWGFRRYDKTIKFYNSFKGNDVFVFHSMKQEYLPLDNSIKTGIIGIGVLKDKKIIENEPYDGAFTPEGLRPIKIYFSDMWFFGSIKNIKDETIQEKKEKGYSYIIKDIYNLTYNILTFNEMKENDCAISTQGAVANVSKDKSIRLINLISKKLTEPHIINY